MDRPTGWRKGQMMFNFLEWLQIKKSVKANQNKRMADPFHVSDEDWDKYWDEFVNYWKGTK